MLSHAFDVRQCQADLFADAVSESEDRETREEQLKDWFELQGVDVHEIDLELDFHEAVCEACDVCPTGDRYFIQVDFNEQLDQYDLLNLEVADCCTTFN